MFIIPNVYNRYMFIKKDNDFNNLHNAFSVALGV